MVRRILIGLSAAAVVGLAMAIWLVGRPLSATHGQRALIIDSSFYGDLIPLPSTDLRGISRNLTVVASESSRTNARQALHQAITRTENRATPTFKQTLNVLLVGLDRRPETRYGGRTDTLVIAVFDRNSSHIGLISVPRDLYVMVPDYGPARINAVWAIAGRQRIDRLDVLERVVEDTLAIPIHHSLVIDLGLFERSVDALGGVNVTVPCPIQDNFVDTRSPTGRRLLNVKAGRQHMDGMMAAMYVRSRHGRSDWDRARRQQAVLYAMRERLISVGGVGRLPALWDELGSSLMTEMSRLEIFRIVIRALQADRSHIHGMVIGYRQTRHWTTPEGRWVLIPDFEAIDNALSRLFSAPSPGARPSGSLCPAANVAISRPDRQRLRRRMRAKMSARQWHAEQQQQSVQQE